MWDKLLMHNSESGNTIIEVLIALVIIGLVLAASYATSTDSVNIIRRSQERTMATKLAEGQLEMIKAKINSGSPDVDDLFSGGGFCLDVDDGTYVAQSASSALAPIASADFTEYEPRCIQDEFFHVHVFRQLDRFKVSVRWERFGGGPLEDLLIVYGARRGIN